MDDAELIAQIRQFAYDLHVYLGTGLLEKVYENGLKHRMEKAGFDVEAQYPLEVRDEDGFILGNYNADLYVNKRIVIELKSAKAITNEHYAQILNYLKITNRPVGLLINFGSFKFEARTVYLRTHSSSFLPFSTAKKDDVTIRDDSRVETEKCRSVAGPHPSTFPPFSTAEIPHG